MIEIRTEEKSETNRTPGLDAAFEHLDRIRKGLELQLSVSHALIAADSDLQPAKELLITLSEAPEEAQELCLKLIEQDTYDHEIALALGNICAELGYLSEAEQAYKLGLELSPDDPRMLSSLSSVLSHVSGRLDEAVSLGRATVENHPRNAASHYLFGRVLEKDGDLQEALIHFAIAAEIDPSNDVFIQAVNQHDRD